MVPQQAATCTVAQLFFFVNSSLASSAPERAEPLLTLRDRYRYRPLPTVTGRYRRYRSPDRYRCVAGSLWNSYSS